MDKAASVWGQSLEKETWEADGGTTPFPFWGSRKVGGAVLQPHLPSGWAAGARLGGFPSFHPSWVWAEQNWNAWGAPPERQPWHWAEAQGERGKLRRIESNKRDSFGII